ncbi:hypothetical protein SAMN04489740_0530 [Arthrobacter alpinus]|uniref:Uncharacterized protein n=1 Tax=Arthrobacter alpinus TaxID=656366 RepID=A0A1H5FKG9_9MICC|nr:hypothetical protein SAMN04489740_0530 [Arthrobacter alpinus]
MWIEYLFIMPENTRSARRVAAHLPRVAPHAGPERTTLHAK